MCRMSRTLPEGTEGRWRTHRGGTGGHRSARNDAALGLEVDLDRRISARVPGSAGGWHAEGVSHVRQPAGARWLRSRLAHRISRAFTEAIFVSPASILEMSTPAALSAEMEIGMVRVESCSVMQAQIGIYDVRLVQNPQVREVGARNFCPHI